jgi:vacuolar-type H+-ATPase subunit C/Vma6
VTAVWDALGPRAIGMATHLLSRAQLEDLTTAESLEVLSVRLERLGFPLPAAGRGLAARLDTALRLAAGQRIERLLRWCGDRPETLAFVSLDEERRAVRRMVRGAIEDLPLEDRLAGLVPTLDLRERRLRLLAAATEPVDVAERLTRFGSPYGPVVAAAVATHPVDLSRLDVAIDRAWAVHALEAARRVAPEAVPFVRQSIDLENLWAALLLRGGTRTERSVEDFLVLEGGDIDVATLRRVARSVDIDAAVRELALYPAVSVWAAEVNAAPNDPAGWEGAILARRLAALTREKRLRPLGATPVLWYWMRLRAQLVDLSRLIWGIALGVPRNTLRFRLVST